VSYGQILRMLNDRAGTPKAEVARKLGIWPSNYSKLLTKEDMLCSTFFNACEAIGYKPEDVCQYLR
jgi:transcriptional regulator with XRE-family HTH domain